MFMPTYNQKNKRTCQKVEKRMNKKRMRSYLSGLTINSALIFPQAISCMRYRVEENQVTLSSNKHFGHFVMHLLRNSKFIFT